MGKASDQKTLQRDRARQRMIARTQETLLGYVFVACLLAALFCGILAVMSIYVFLRIGTTQQFLLTLPATLGALLFGWLTKLCLRGMTKLKRKVERLSYVPRTIDGALPPANILVRGASEPTVAQKESLLRAAAGSETPDDGLLRASADEQDDTSKEEQ